MNLFSELLIDRSRLEQLSSEIGRAELNDTVEHLSRISAICRILCSSFAWFR